MSHRYIVVAGNPIKLYNGTTTFTGLNIVYSSDNLDECNQQVTDCLFDTHSGLLIIIDTHTNRIV